MLQSAIKANPFYPPPKQWQIRIFIERNFIAYIDEAFGDIALAILNFEVVEDDSNWAVDIITDISPEKAEIVTRLALLSGMLNIATPLYEVKELHAKDWVREVEASFPPLYVGRFYVHGSHVQDSPPVSKISLEVNAGAAFGSGEHATTSGCLLALTKLAKQRKFVKTLDMGCGSGILALAAAKLWSRPVVAVDID
ncbi:MAG: 50S ribosomal protein L11 methyltransferase, partial [Pseudomonadota bacterium]